MSTPTANNASLPGQNWVQDLAFEVALGYFAPEELVLKFEISEAQLDTIQKHPAFKRAVKDYRRQIDDEGDAFRLRAKKSAELALEVPNRIAHDDLVDPATRLKAVDQIVQYAGWGKKDDKDSSGVTINIKTYAGEPTTTGVTIEGGSHGGQHDPD